MATQKSPVSRYLASVIVEWEREKTLTSLAEKLSISRAQLINVRDGDRGAGSGLEEKFAAFLHDGSVDKLRAAAAEYVKTHGGEVSGEPERYASRAASIAWARAVGYPRAAIDEIASMDLHSGGDTDVDPGGDYWMDQLRAARSRVLAAGGGPVKPGGRKPGAHERDALGGGPPKKKRGG